MARQLLWLPLIIGTTLSAQVNAVPDIAGWRADLRLLASELPRRHPAPFLHIPRAQWDSAVTGVEQRLPQLTRNQALVEFFRLVTLIGDAHTTIEAEPAVGLRRYPIELYSFEDGLFVRRADSAHAGIVGAKVLRIGLVSSDTALTRVTAIIPHENDWWVRAFGPFYLMMPEFLDGLGLVADAERMPLVIERNGRRETVVIAPTAPTGEGARAGWPTMRRAAPPLWEQRRDEMFWWRYLPESATLYVCMRAVQPGPRSNTNRRQWDEVFAVADSMPIARMVIDLRENTGGNGGLNRYPVQQILRRPALDRSDRLFVVIGRRTFSAGQQFTNLLEAWTRATLVGEPTGQRPTQYGDHRPLELPNSHLTVRISTVFHQAPDEFDTRSFVPPAIYAPLSAADYSRGIDPALVAILARDTTPSVVGLVEGAVTAGDTSEAERVLSSAQGAVANRYRSLESEINALGYRLLSAGATANAIAVFRINTRVYDRSANTFDSLGEALLTAGRRDEAIAAYRHALEIEPGFPPSVQALERLGVR